MYVKKGMSGWRDLKTRRRQANGYAEAPRPSRLVGVAGFEPTTSSSRTTRANRTALHPEVKIQNSNIQKPSVKSPRLSSICITH